MKRLLTVAYMVILVSGIVWGIMYLENMRKESAAEALRNTESALHSDD